MDIPKEFLPVLLVQIALFLGLWMVLKRLWFDPALKVIGAREARSHGAIAEARVLQAEADRLRREHEAAIEQARAEAQRDVQELLRQAEAEQRTLIAQATEEAQRASAEVRERVAREVEAARRDLQAQAPQIAREVARVVLGRAG
jgi:F-type H+-transporting ATPase subunit b